ncbi:hypothetical protein LR69_00533 [Geobacillus sp. BCO2]|nr:hypothetical protein LR69_00533 [Geobacillus sp. BCO2]
MSNKGRQNKVNQETANPTVSKAEAEMAKDSVDTAKQAKRTARSDSEAPLFWGQPRCFAAIAPAAIGPAAHFDGD